MLCMLEREDDKYNLKSLFSLSKLICWLSGDKVDKIKAFQVFCSEILVPSLSQQHCH